MQMSRSKYQTSDKSMIQDDEVNSESVITNIVWSEKHIE